MKQKVKNIIRKIKKFNYKYYFNTSILFFTFVITNLINGMLLRFFTVHNYFAIKPILADLALILLLGSFVYLFKPKNRFKYLLIVSLIFNVICIVNSLYYTYYMSFASFSLIAVSLTVVDVGDAVTKNVMQPKDFIFLWQIITLFIVHAKLKKKGHYVRVASKENKKKRFTGTIISAICVYALFFATVTSVEYSRLAKQWNREFLVSKFGVYTYQLNDLFKSLDAKFNTLFGYDNAAKEFRDYYSIKEAHKSNEYTNMFKDYNLILIHAESIQNVALRQTFNGQQVAPNLNRLKDEGIYFSNYYAQASSGTSSDSEFTISTSLLPVTNGAVAISYWNREYETIQKLLKNQGYRTISMHGNTGSFWNRINFHNSLGYDKFYSKSDYNIDEVIGLGISDKSFFSQSVDILKKEHEEYGKFMATLIMLSNHTPFDEIDKYGEFPVDIKEEVTTTNELGEQITETKSYPYMEETKLGNYFKSVHYADSAIGELMTKLDENGLLDKSIVVIYGDHDAKLPKSDFVRLYNYDKEIDDIKSKEDETYIDVDYFKYELDRSVPFIIWSKDKKLSKTIDTAMGMYDAAPTVENMLGVIPTYNIGNDIMNLNDNIVVFPNGNWVTNNIYYNSQKDQYKILNMNYVINNDEISKNNEIASKKLNISNDIILYDLIKNEKDKLQRVEGE
ncbi:MAG: sulfatase-like hydrolase/transferase [Bacilli bacterium]|nr:sulfatase-like hydrolase/transferase [Bacilli bacterium]